MNDVRPHQRMAERPNERRVLSLSHITSAAAAAAAAAAAVHDDDDGDDEGWTQARYHACCSIQTATTIIPLWLIRYLLLQELVEDVAVATSSRHADLSRPAGRVVLPSLVRDSLAAGQPPRF